MGKGSKKRPCFTGREEEDLRFALAYGDIDMHHFQIEYEKLLRAGMITREGRKLRKGSNGKQQEII